MTDKEKVIKGLECHAEVNCVECPYRDGWRTCPFGETLLADAIALLKEQESVIEALKSDLDETLAVLGEKPEIVRCADCKYCVKEPSGELYCEILAVGYEPLGSKKVNGDWYCADGERR